MIKKITNLIIALITIFIVAGLVFSSSARNNLMALLDSLSNSGAMGVVVVISLILSFWSVPKTIVKIYKVKGINSKFWEDD
jgi:hypothetical protein